MENIIECSICLERYDKKEKLPRILTCGHTFCTSCLIKIKEKNKPDNKIKCPLDSKLEADKNSIEEIPINRVIVDLLDLNLPEKIKEDKNKQNKNDSNIFLNVKNKLQSLYSLYDFSTKEISDSLSYLLLSKEKCENSIINYYDTLINKLINRKEYMLNILYNYIDEKNSYYNLLLEKLSSLSKLSNDKIKKVDTAIKIQEKNDISDTDKIDFISSLDLNSLEDNDFIKQLNFTLNEIKSGYIPTVLYDKNENIEKFAETVINYLTLNIENIINYSEYENSINSNIKQLKENNDSKKEIDNSFSLFKEENIQKKKDEAHKKLNHFFDNKINELSNSFSKMDLSNSPITKLLWFNQGTNKIFSYDLIGNNQIWKEINNMNNFTIPISPSISQLSNDIAFISGGCTKINEVSKKCYLYKKGKFELLNDMFNERRNHFSLRVNEYIYVCGGIDNNSNHLNSCEKYSLQYEKWIKCSPLNIERSHLSLCNVNNKYIYAIGGENKKNGFLDSIEKYSILGDSWECMKIKLPYKLECVGCITSNNKEIVIFGGYCPQKIKRETIIKYNIDTQKINFSDKQLNILGWSIYMPIKINNYINVILGGDENEQPIIEKFQTQFL
jgi:hypothetical protein